MPEDDFLQLQQVAAEKPNVTLRRYTSRLLDYLNQADFVDQFGWLQYDDEFVEYGGAIAPAPFTEP